MDDLISRQAAIDALCKRCELVADKDEPCGEKCNDIKILEKLPSEQHEIIRCKECEHSYEDEDEYGTVDMWCKIWDEICEDNGFCNYAERV